MTAKRLPVPKPGVTAAKARALGVIVPFDMPDDAVVTCVVDRYPREYAWTLHWSNGVRSGMRQPSDPPSGFCGCPPCAARYRKRVGCTNVAVDVLSDVGAVDLVETARLLVKALGCDEEDVDLHEAARRALEATYQRGRRDMEASRP